MNNLILVGFMACGKSTVGKILAQQLSREFLDTDAMIEKKAGKAISAIFFEEGEDVFRTWETIIARYILELSNKVVSTGGGMIVKNHSLLRQAGHLVYLRVSPQTILARTNNNYQQRPLLNYPTADERLAVITKLLSKREQFYQYYADTIIDNNGNDPQVTCQKIIETLGLKK